MMKTCLSRVSADANGPRTATAARCLDHSASEPTQGGFWRTQVLGLHHLHTVTAASAEQLHGELLETFPSDMFCQARLHFQHGGPEGRRETHREFERGGDGGEKWKQVWRKRAALRCSVRLNRRNGAGTEENTFFIPGNSTRNYMFITNHT